MVRAQIPINSLSCSDTKVKQGQNVSVSVVLNSPAPDSNTRVYLTASPQDQKIPSFVDVPAGTTHVDFSITAISNIVQPVEVALTASTVGKAQVLRLVAQP